MIGANLPCSCLQCLTGDQEQTKAGTGGEKLQEVLVDQLAHKAIEFLGGSKPDLPPPPCFSLCSRVSVQLRSPTFLLIEIMGWTFSNISATLACPSLACPLLSEKPKEWYPLPVSPYTSYLTPHPSTFSPMSRRHFTVLHSGGHALSSSSTLLGTVAFGHYEDPLFD